MSHQTAATEKQKETQLAPTPGLRKAPHFWKIAQSLHAPTCFSERPLEKSLASANLFRSCLDRALGSFILSSPPTRGAVSTQRQQFQMQAAAVAASATAGCVSTSGDFNGRHVGHPRRVRAAEGRKRGERLRQHL
eukprot:1619255-Amphidinium_carterae.1